MLVSLKLLALSSKMFATLAYATFPLILSQRPQHSTTQHNLLWLVEEKVNDIVSPFRMIKKHKQRPVDEPCSLLKRLQWRADRLKEIYNIGLSHRKLAQKACIKTCNC